MNSKKAILAVIIIIAAIRVFGQDESNKDKWIRVNQIGYKPDAYKTAVLLSYSNKEIESFSIHDALTDEEVFISTAPEHYGKYAPFNYTVRLNFTDFSEEGTFYIKSADTRSPVFRISETVYDDLADFILKYMRQQRCGFNPLLKDSCHTEDGFIIYHPKRDSEYINVMGGWHDASDYLQYTTTSANATFRMLFAYSMNPGAYSDEYDADGLDGANGIPDILDEAKWGIDWLLKMNPEKEIMFNQIADDRDHKGFRLPNRDTISYGKGLMRPVYFCTGEPQGVMEHQNRSDGIASTAGKFASSFGMAAMVLGDFYPELKEKLIQKAVDAFEFGLENPGVCQTAPCRAPYFYEEDNWMDDMELASAVLYKLTGDDYYLEKSAAFGREERVTPWMGKDTARHYQWYPFMNLGHYFLASHGGSYSDEFTGYLKAGIDSVESKCSENPFYIGVPFIWCSNNLVSALLNQIELYKKLTGTEQYDKMEAALRDWLFGCNPWGTSMITGLPAYGDYPDDIHSAFTYKGEYEVDGGLVDGPVYSSIYNNLLGITLYQGDEYSDVQPDRMVYHDDYGDYSTNEPTMDGTASLSYYFSSLHSGTDAPDIENGTRDNGGLIRGGREDKEIYLIFSGHEFADGAETIINTLEKENIKGSFFFTGDFYREYPDIIMKLKEKGHYLGAHSDKHLLYADWENRDSTLVTREEFTKDIKNNYKQMHKAGISPDEAQWYLPPYEWYNSEVSAWAESLGLHIINFTPGTYSNADYTIPSMGERYLSSEEIYNRILRYEKEDPDGLNGFFLLMHFGVHPEREDKFYNKLDDLINELKSRGYSFKVLEK